MNSQNNQMKSKGPKDKRSCIVIILLFFSFVSILLMTVLTPLGDPLMVRLVELSLRKGSVSIDKNQIDVENLAAVVHPRVLFKVAVQPDPGIREAVLPYARERKRQIAPWFSVYLDRSGSSKRLIALDQFVRIYGYGDRNDVPEKLINSLVSCTKDSDAKIRLFSLQIVLHYFNTDEKKQRFAPVYRKLLNDENAKIRKWAVYALGYIRDRESVEGLIKALDDEQGVSSYAVAALARTGDKKALAPLEKELDNADFKGSRKFLHKAVTELKGENQGSFFDSIYPPPDD